MRISAIDPAQAILATRIVEIQRAAYAIEAELMGFDGIPQLSETVADIVALDHLTWRAGFEDGQIAGIIAWVVEDGVADIDRLAVDPAFARCGHGRRLVQSVPTDLPTIVSTGAKNEPAIGLYLSEGFAETGRTEVVPGIFTAQFARAPTAIGHARHQA